MILPNFYNFSLFLQITKSYQFRALYLYYPNINYSGFLQKLFYQVDIVQEIKIA